MEKAAPDIHEIFRRLRLSTARLPKAAMFQLRDEGFGDPFRQLIGSLISVRTRDEATVVICRRLFATVGGPDDLLALDDAVLTGLLAGASFPDGKARTLKTVARRIKEDRAGRVPDTVEGLLTLPGVGPKVAALTLAVSAGVPAIAVDIHVHRVTNRWGYVRTTSPEGTMKALTAILPREYWIEINERLVPFGKFVCTGTRPKCSACPVLEMCRQVGVGAHR